MRARAALLSVLLGSVVALAVTIVLFRGGEADPVGALPRAQTFTANGTIGIGTMPGGNGYVIASADGEVQAFGSAVQRGDASGLELREPIVDVEMTPTGNGYWLVAADGGVFSFGDADFHGSTGAIDLDQPVVGLVSTPSGAGYWLVASDGGVFAFGDARFFGSTGGLALRQPVVAIDATDDGDGYWMVGADGGVFSFGQARFHGSTGGLTLDAPVIDLYATDGDGGYRLFAEDGGEFTFGDATFIGSVAERGVRFSAVAVRPQGDGHWFVTPGGQLQQSGLAPRLGAPVAGPPVGPPPDLGSSSLTLETLGQFSEPIAVRTRPGEATNLYVAERAGRLIRWNPTTDARTTVVDVTGLTDTRSERGLLGFDFSPDGRFVYLDHTDLGGSVELVEYDLETSPPTRRFLLEIPQFQANHNGGDVHVTSDGLVWASSGDGGSAGDPQNNGQDRSNLLGTIYRIDPTPSGGQPYTVPADNPFVGEAGVSPEIWAYGLRNPWRFDIDEASGMIWIADVGQGAEEEINRHPLNDPGPNFGWKRFEGDRFFADVPAPDPVFPVHTYGHNPECSVSGGVVYAGAIEQLRDAYVFGDWCTGGLSAVRVDAGGGVEAASLGVVAPRVVAFGHDHDGEILVVEFGGRIRRVIEN